MKTVLIGSVGSSREMLQAMIDVNFPITYIFSLDESVSKNVAGYQPLHVLAEKSGIMYKKFTNINDKENVDLITEIAPDYIFVIGLSQLVKKEIIDSAKIGVVGFHPTPLPKMRGRAANVWQILLGVHETKCTLFFINEGIDAGDILGQESYYIEDTDYVSDVGRKINNAAKILFRKVLCDILDNKLTTQKQNEADATYLLKRSPEDGLIDWNLPINKIHTLIRAVSKPFPGAYGMYDGVHHFIIWRAEVLENRKFIGLNGQIANITDTYIDVVCKDGLLRITEFENVDNVKLLAGHKLR